MDEEKLFELAVRLVEANIRAGQYVDTRGFETIVHDQVLVAYEGLAAVWSEVSAKGEDIH